MSWLALAIVALFSVGSAHPPPPTEWSSYESEAGWSIRHPPDWTATALSPTGEAVVFVPSGGPAATSVMVVVGPRPAGGIGPFMDEYLDALEAKHPGMQTPFVHVDRTPFRQRAQLESWETHVQGERYFSRTFEYHGSEIVLFEGEFRAAVDLQGEPGDVMRTMVGTWRG